MKYVNVKLLTMMTSVIFMMTAGPAAFGQATTETHASDAFPLGAQLPNTPFQFQSVNTVTVVSGASVDIRTSGVFVYFSQTGTFPPTNIPVNLGAPEPDPTVFVGQKTCIEAVPDTDIGDMMWVLTHSTDNLFTTTTPVTAEHTDIGVLPSILWFDSIFPAGGPVVLNPGIPNQLGPVGGDGFGSGQPATLGFSGTATLSPALDNNNEFYYWQKININGDPIPGGDSTGMGGSYFYVMCAYLDGSGGVPPNDNTSPQDDDWGGLVINANDFSDNSAGAENENIVVAQFFVRGVVGGALMTAGSTSLLVAGAQSNALWILAILGLAGTIIAIRKLEA